MRAGSKEVMMTLEKLPHVEGRGKRSNRATWATSGTAGIAKAGLRAGGPSRTAGSSNGRRWAIGRGRVHGTV